MPKQAVYTLTWSSEKEGYELSTQGHCQHLFRAGDEQQWFAWVTTHSASFTFQGRSGTLNVCNEVRKRGGAYWYAYHYARQRLLKRYLGKTSTLSIDRLEETAQALSGETLPDLRPTQPPGEHPLPLSASPTQAEIQERPLLSSRLSPPRLPVLLLERTLLLTRLDTARIHGLVLLQAPAGFGKTTSVHHWIALRRADPTFPPVAWLSLDAADNDPLRFWRLIITACQAFSPTFGASTLSQLEHVVSSPSRLSDHSGSLTILLNELAGLPSGGLLILDDYHTITSELIHETLAFFLDNLPTTLCVMLLSRREPPLPLRRWRARGDLSELHASDLRFSREETAQFLHQALPTPLSERVLTHVESIVEGWATGLRLLCLALPEVKTPADVEHVLLALGEHTGTRNHHQSLLDYFIHEVLSAQPEPLRLFLLQTSILSRLNGPLCDAVTEKDDSALFLETVEQAGLFLEAADEPFSSIQNHSGPGERRGNKGGFWYRYHGLFAEALRREASHCLGDETLRTLARRASLWYEQHAFPSEAIEAALFVQDVERIADLIERADADWSLPELPTLRRWLLQIPTEVLQPYPLLCLYAALVVVFQGGEASVSAAEKQRIERLLQMAEQVWQNPGTPTFLSLAGASRALSGESKGLSMRLVEHAKQALDALPKERLNRHIRLWQSICLAIVGLGNIREGRFEEKRQMIQEEYVRSLTVGNSDLTRAMLLLLGLGSFTEGKLYQASEYYQQVLSQARAEEDYGDSAQALLGLAQISFEWNDLVRAEQEANEALALLHNAGSASSAPAAIQLARLSHARGQTASAQQQIALLVARLEAIPPTFIFGLLPHVFPTVLLQQARLHLATGNVQAAQRSVEQLSQQTLDFIQRIETQILQARINLAQDQVTAARHELESLLPIIEAQRLGAHLLETRLLLAQVEARCKQDRPARLRLQEALTLGCHEGFLRLFLAEGEPLTRLLRRVAPTLQNKALHAYAQTILQASPSMNNDASVPQNLFDPLSPQELRVLRLLVAGQTNAEIAQTLVVSIHTVKDHVGNLYSKLGVHNRLQASEMARHLKLV